MSYAVYLYSFNEDVPYLVEYNKPSEYELQIDDHPGSVTLLTTQGKYTQGENFMFESSYIIKEFNVESKEEFSEKYPEYIL
jgi:hypothetical protein